MSFVKKTCVLRLKHETNARFNPDFCRELVWQSKERAEALVVTGETLLEASENRKSRYSSAVCVNRKSKAINEKSPIGINRSGFVFFT